MANISHVNIPSTIAVPLFYGEVDNSQANLATGSVWSTILFGQSLEGSTAEDKKPLLIGASSQANNAFGRGSQLARMVNAFRANCPTGQLYCMPLKATEGDKAKGRLTIKGTSTESGYLNIYVGSDRVRVAVPNKTESNAIVDLVINAIKANQDLPVTAERTTQGEGETSATLTSALIDDTEGEILKGLKEIKNGSITITVDSKEQELRNIDLSKALSFTDVASVIDKAQTQTLKGAYLLGSPIDDSGSTLLNELKQIRNGSLKINVDGQLREIKNIDLDSSISLEQVAEKINTAQTVQATSGALHSATLDNGSSQIVNALKSVSDGSIKFVIDGETINATAIAFNSGVTTMDHVATKLQEKTNNKATVKWVTDHLEIVSKKTGTASSVNYCQAGEGGTTTIAQTLKLRQEDQAKIVAGADPIEALANISYETSSKQFKVASKKTGLTSTVDYCQAGATGTTTLAEKLKLRTEDKGLIVFGTEVTKPICKVTFNTDKNRFVLTSLTKGELSTIGHCTVGKVGTTTLATTLRLTNEAGAQIVNGKPKEDLTGAIDIICKGVGEYGNGIPLQMDLRGMIGGEKPLNGVSVTIRPMQGGTAVLDVQSAIAKMGNLAYDFIGVPWNDSDTLDKFSAEMNDLSGRWSYARMLYGHVITVKRGGAEDDLNDLVAFGLTRNDQHASVLGIEHSFASCDFDVVGALTGLSANAINADPARPLQSLTLETILGAETSEAFDLTERNTLLLNGIASQNTNSDRSVTLNRLITSYRVNTFGDQDTSYFDAERLWILSFIQRYVKTRITSKYPRSAIADDVSKVAPGKAVVSPAILKAELIGIFNELELQGIVEGVSKWGKDIIVERDTNNRDRVDMLLPVDIINGLRIIAETTQFRS